MEKEKELIKKLYSRLIIGAKLKTIESNENVYLINIQSGILFLPESDYKKFLEKDLKILKANLKKENKNDQEIKKEIDKFSSEVVFAYFSVKETKEEFKHIIEKIQSKKENKNKGETDESK